MRDVPYLRVVPDTTEGWRKTEKRDERSATQLSLFPLGNPNTIAVVVMETISGARFFALLANLRPTVVVDLRPYPRFDFSGYDRATAFRDFRRAQTLYLHLARLDVGTAEHLAEWATGAASRQVGGGLPSGPLMVLCDAPSLIGVDAAHIRWHAHGGPDEVSNGLALCALHHRLFDHGAITVREDLRVRVARALAGRSARDPFRELDGQPIRPPVDQQFYPSREHLRWHHAQVFQGQM